LSWQGRESRLAPTWRQPLFSGAGSKLTLTPVMNTDDLMKGLAAVAAG
jgi:hypothetical protein